MPGHSLPVRQGLSSLGLWGLTPAKPLPSQLPRPRCGTGRGNASPPPAYAHCCWASVWHSLPLPSSFFFLNIKTLPILDTPCPCHAVMRLGFVPSRKRPLPALPSPERPAASSPRPLSRAARTAGASSRPHRSERASKRLARRRAQGRGSSRGRSELSVCVELRNRTEGGCPTGGGGESRSSWPAQRRRHLIRSAGCRFCKSPARCEHYVTSFP